MSKLVGIKFPHTLKIYDFLPGDLKINPRDFVVTETVQGVEIGQVVYIDKEIKSDGDSDIKKILRKATKEDIEKEKLLLESAKSILPIFVEKIEKYKLPMTPVGVNYSLDETRAIYYFTSEGRVDFRELAKDLSRTIQKQAVLRQIGPRDEASLIGGYGRCGREICCGTFLRGIEGISMEKIEAQFGGPKNVNKISGICGRLMCCLNYEEAEKKSTKNSKISTKEKL